MLTWSCLKQVILTRISPHCCRCRQASLRFPAPSSTPRRPTGPRSRRRQPVLRRPRSRAYPSPPLPTRTTTRPTRPCCRRRARRLFCPRPTSIPYPRPRTPTVTNRPALERWTNICTRRYNQGYNADWVTKKLLGCYNRLDFWSECLPW